MKIQCVDSKYSQWGEKMLTRSYSVDVNEPSGPTSVQRWSAASVPDTKTSSTSTWRPVSWDWEIVSVDTSQWRTGSAAVVEWNSLRNSALSTSRLVVHAQRKANVSVKTVSVGGNICIALSSRTCAFHIGLHTTTQSTTEIVVAND